jgi:hypothetical protein
MNLTSSNDRAYLGRIRKNPPANASEGRFVPLEDLDDKAKDDVPDGRNSKEIQRTEQRKGFLNTTIWLDAR